MQANTPTTPGNNPHASIVLFASEMQAPGGVQSYMWHLVSALTASDVARPEYPGSDKAPLRLTAIVSYADRSNLRTDPRLQGLLARGLPVQVAHRSRLQFIAHAWRATPKGSVVVVGHPAQAPVAAALKALGRISAYVVCLHGIEAWCTMKPAARAALRRADRIIVTTPYTALECSTLNDIELKRFQTIALSAGQFHDTPARNVTAPFNTHFNAPFNVLFVARQDQCDLYKGFIPAFKAIAQMRQAGLSVVLHMVGGGDFHENLKQIARQQLGAHATAIRFHGRLPDAQLQAAYAACDVFLMPSLKEGFGIVFLEAMRHAKPCIGGWQGGTPWVIEDGLTGYLIPAHDHQRLANRLIRLYADPALCALLGHNAQQRFEQRFSFDQFCRQWRLLVDTLVQHPTPPLADTLGAAKPKADQPGSIQSNTAQLAGH